MAVLKRACSNRRDAVKIPPARLVGDMFFSELFGIGFLIQVVPKAD